LDYRVFEQGIFLKQCFRLDGQLSVEIDEFVGTVDSFSSATLTVSREQLTSFSAAAVVRCDSQLITTIALIS